MFVWLRGCVAACSCALVRVCACVCVLPCVCLRVCKCVRARACFVCICRYVRACVSLHGCVLVCGFACVRACVRARVRARVTYSAQGIHSLALMERMPSGELELRSAAVRVEVVAAVRPVARAEHFCTFLCACQQIFTSV